MNEEQNEQLINAINDLKDAVSSGSVSTEKAVLGIQDKLDHMSGQLNVMNHSLYVANEYIMWGVISTMILAAMMMFLVGYVLTRK